MEIHLDLISSNQPRFATNSTSLATKVLKVSSQLWMTPTMIKHWHLWAFHNLSGILMTTSMSSIERRVMELLKHFTMVISLDFWNTLCWPNLENQICSLNGQTYLWLLTKNLDHMTSPSNNAYSEIIKL